MRWGVAVVLAGLLALPVNARAGRAITGPCRTVFCAGISQDGSRVVFPFEEELTAGAGDRQLYEWSSGGTLRPLLPPDLKYWPQLDGVSADATHVFVTTNLTLSPEDADGFGIDVYDISGRGATLVSGGPSDAGPFASFMGASPDGARVFFEAFAPPAPGSAGTCPDLYERFAGQTFKVALDPHPPSPPVCDAAKFGGISADGTHVFFTTGAELEPGDERGEDIYQRVGSSLTRLTTYPEPEGTCVDLVTFADASSDGGTVLFSTNTQVVPADTDSTFDVYERHPDGTFSLVSRGTDGGSQTCGFGGDRPIALSADGGTAIFETTARLSPADTDSSNDLYSVSAGGSPELLSTGPSDPNTDERSIVYPDWLALASDDAKRVAFETKQRLVQADRDASTDVYLRAEGRTELISAGAPGARTNGNAELLALSGDGSTVVFATTDPLVAGDRDGQRDIYLHRAGQDKNVLLSGETIAPLMRIAKRGSLLPSGAVGVTLACPKAETSGPCRGRLVLSPGRRRPRLGAASFRIAPGRRLRVAVRPRDRYRGSVPVVVLARAHGADALGNARISVRRIRIGGAARG